MIIRLLPDWHPFIALTIFPYIVTKKTVDLSPSLLQHEKIHLEQQKELLIVFAYIIYALDFLGKLIYYRSVSKAYYNVSFEREAYLNQDDLDYLSTRKPYSFLKYLWY